MPAAYRQRALTVLLLFGVLSAAVALLASSLIFQLPVRENRAGDVPGWAISVMVPVAAALAALCLVLNLSCLLLCLLHGYFSTELCRGQHGHERAEWFLLDNRKVRHAAIGLFCCGISFYLTALAVYMVLALGLRAGIPGACILSSGILVLLITVIHTLVQAWQVSWHNQPGASQILLENDSAQQGESSSRSELSKDVAALRSRPEIHRKFSFPAFLERKSQPGSAGSSNLSSSGSARDGSAPPRMHRALSVESGLLQAQGKAWSVITQEMGNVMARKHGASGKDSTLV